MNMQLVNEVTKSQLKKDVPFFKPGCTVRVHVKIKEGDKSRIQVFEGLVIEKHGGGISEAFTVRKISNQIGVERTFPIHSPIIDKIEVIHTRLVSGASKSNFFSGTANIFVIAPLIQYAITEVIIIKNLIVKIQASNCT